MIFPRAHYAFDEFRGGARRFAPPLNTPLVSGIAAGQSSSVVCTALITTLTVPEICIVGGARSEKPHLFEGRPDLVSQHIQFTS